MNTEKLDAAVNSHILYNMSRQMMREFEAQTSVAGDVAEATSGTNTDGDEINVYEWWLVSQDFAYAAKKAGEVIVETPFGTIWGRQTTGQRISLDLNVQDIFKAMHEI